jgi:hypothetical protein
VTSDKDGALSPIPQNYHDEQKEQDCCQNADPVVLAKIEIKRTDETKRQFQFYA